MKVHDTDIDDVVYLEYIAEVWDRQALLPSPMNFEAIGMNGFNYWMDNVNGWLATVSYLIEQGIDGSTIFPIADWDLLYLTNLDTYRSSFPVEYVDGNILPTLEMGPYYSMERVFHLHK